MRLNGIKQHWQMAIILSIFFLIRIKHLFIYHNIVWDEAVYIGMGKYLFSGGSIGIWENIRPIGLPLLLGGVWKIGLNPILFGEVLSILFSSGSIFLVYLITYETYGNREKATIAALIFASFPVFFYNAQFILTGIPSVFFSLIGVYYFLRNKFLLCGVFISISAMFRFTFIGLVLMVFILTLIRESFWKRIREYSLGIGLVFISYFTFNFFMYYPSEGFFLSVVGPLFEASSHQWNVVHAFGPSNLMGKIMSSVYYYPKLLIANSPIYIFGLIGAVISGYSVIKQIMKKGRKGIKRVMNEKENVILLLFVGLFIYFSYIMNKQPRFGISFLPYVAIISANYFVEFVRGVKFGKRINERICLIVLIIFLVLPIKINFDQFSWRENEPNQITNEFFFFFERFKLNGTVLTTNPTFAAYGDNLMVWYYDNIEEAMEVYERENNNFVYVVFTEDFYPCIEEMERCKEVKEYIKQDIKKKEIMFQKKYDGEEYIIAKNEIT